MHRFALPLALSLATPLGAQQAVDPPGFWDFFTVERLGQAVASQLVLTGRAFADLRYDGLSVDPISGQIAITGLDVAPTLPGLAPGACTIRADRVSVRGAPFDRVDELRVSVTLAGAVVDFDCLPPEARPVVGMMGLTDIAVDRLDLSLLYDLPSGAMDMQIEASVDGLVRLSADAQADYVSYRMNLQTEEPEPSVLLRRARVQIEDRGLADRARQILPPQMLEPQAAVGTVQQALTQAFGPGPLNPAQSQLVEDAGAVVVDLLEGGRSVTLEATIDPAPLRLDAAALEDPGTLITALAPRLTDVSARLRSSLPRDLLIAAAEERLDDADRLRVGRALITGDGAPRNLSLAATTLLPLAQRRDPEAAHLLAEGFADIAPVPAYRDAITAVAAGRTQALGLLERLEAGLPLEQVLEIQSDAAPAASRDPMRFSTLADMRTAAFAHASGIGAPRSFASAYFWAAMAAAAGDSAGEALRDELDTRMRLRGLGDVWAEMTQTLDADVLRGWIETDVPARLQAN
ncbi:hypothetical protein KDD17_05320 [Sulfitobacter albidus]|uniref:DUF2059 domain-containing protein n=1 Tax=Sulfitobacter albidus TaxID=2829501 RepID=A0A975PNK8_9RHOB|nr:hypothetical protein [Sulfitobacter albidus]QUJ77420.1 hypothetical protein KDD17_05320 [Sulfitobacter albidus]